MTRLEPLPPDALPSDLKAMFAAATAQLGFPPNDVLVMAHWPDLLRVLGPLVFTVWAPGMAHYAPRQVAEIVAVIGLFGFLNRWNATLRVPLEAAPRLLAEQTVSGHGWHAGRHGEV